MGFPVLAWLHARHCAVLAHALLGSNLTRDERPLNEKSGSGMEINGAAPARCQLTGEELVEGL